MSQTKIPTWMTYRSTSSGPGQEEFMGNITHPFTHFASSDYPLPKQLYNSLHSAGKEMIHLPVLVGAIGVFHSVPLKQPNGPLEMIDLNLTSCLVARIYQGDITDWNHPEIVEINPNMDLPVALNNYGKPKEDQSFPIHVVHRDTGSSSAYALTAYLHKSCPEHWDAHLVGNTVDWPLTGDERYISAQGTSTMIAAILDTPGAIGFADAGLALDQGVSEVALKMEQVTINGGFFLTTNNALKKNGVSATLDAQGANIPTSGDADWSGVDLINQVEGYIYAWPMVLMTYILVRKDLPTFISDPRAQSLLVAFLKALYDPAYMGHCEEEYRFLPVKGNLRDMALESIDMLELSPDAPDWIQEIDILPYGGQGDYVISTRRKQILVIDQGILMEKVHRAEVALEAMTQEMTAINVKSNEIEIELEKVALDQGIPDDLLSDEQERINASFGMGIVSLVLWFFSIVVIYRQQAKLSRLEVIQNQILEQAKKKSRHHHRRTPNNTNNPPDQSTEESSS